MKIIYNQFKYSVNDILYDDRDCVIGKKLSDNDLIGIPYQIIIGKRDVKDNLVEFKNRFKNNLKKYLLMKLLIFYSKKSFSLNVIYFI